MQKKMKIYYKSPFISLQPLGSETLSISQAALNKGAISSLFFVCFVIRSVVRFAPGRVGLFRRKC